ncbi:hypothetical protein EG327_007874 [Venturia inaequalis]|uniref:Glutamine synthetase n=1 Tax=Venturia inaequalis TaxID=5025 RepID=A0A8H3YYY9_VENIN|nr:hypothetical protein EG327_007874 [Venturia inaequalis]
MAEHSLLYGVWSHAFVIQSDAIATRRQERLKLGSGLLSMLEGKMATNPVIDNHAHNLLLPSEYQNHPFQSITTEASGDALDDTYFSLPHLRAWNQLKELYQYDGPDGEWDCLKERQKWLDSDPDRLIRKCLTGTYSILIDDGLGNPHTMHPYDYHNQFTLAPCKRILRIETLAEHLMQGIVRRATEKDLAVAEFMADTFLLFTERFEIQIQQAIDDPEVAGFKSVICYRSGLDIDANYEHCLRKIGPPFEHYITRCVAKKRYRVDSKHVNDYLVLKTLEILTSRAGKGISKPLQLHTGLGDRDIDLLRSNPAYLQPVIEEYPSVPFVLLHSAYPYTREAGYLASTYKNAYLDIGEVFPMLSRDGEVQVLRQALELVPYNKLLWSTDGHYFPETYWLANKQFREVLEEVLVEYTRENDLSESQAIDLATGLMFNSSNDLYKMGYPPQLGEKAAPRALPLVVYRAPGPGEATYDIRIWENFMKLHPETRFVFVQWLDYMGQMRSRIYPAMEFNKMVNNGTRISIAQGNTGTLQNDTVTEVVNTTGQIYVEPDLGSLRPAWHAPMPAATVMSRWCDINGAPIKECARCHLQSYLQELQSEHSTHLLVGFEIECVFLRRNPENGADPYLPLTTTHAWGTMSPEQWTNLLPIVLEISEALAAIGINLQAMHSESHPAYEFVLPPLPPVQATDTLYQTRQVIATIAESHGLRVTLHPHPFPSSGSGQHTHISLNSSELEPDALDKKESQFWAGVLAHLEAICAFALPEKESYDRVGEDHWSGGVWVAWGTQNREVPLRKAGERRWEVRCLDGFANMYLVLGAIVAAGLLGLREEMDMVIKDCPYNTARLDDVQRAEYGITRMLPRSIGEAMNALESDSSLKEALAEDLVKNFLIMKEAEQEMLDKMGDEERRIWLVERY